MRNQGPFSDRTAIEDCVRGVAATLESRAAVHVAQLQFH
jgi:hypothetical protein